MKKTRAKRRHQRVSAMKRKANIWATLYGEAHAIPGMLAKGKVHCSCWMCSRKSKVHGLSHSDLKALARDVQKLREQQ